MLKNGSKVKGTYTHWSLDKAAQFTGYIHELNGISTIDLDQPLPGTKDYTDRIYADFDHVTGKGKNIQVVEVVDIPGSEVELLPLSHYAVESLHKEYGHLTLQSYRASVESRLTTYRTVKKSVTCEYGHKHMVDQREAVKPTIDAFSLNIAYFFHCMAEYARYMDQAEYMQKNETWHRLASKLSLGGGAFTNGTNRTEISWDGIPKETAKKINAELDQQYESLCDDYLIAIYGKHLDRYLAMQSRISGSNQRARLKAQGKIA